MRLYTPPPSTHTYSSNTIIHTYTYTIHMLTCTRLRPHTDRRTHTHTHKYTHACMHTRGCVHAWAQITEECFTVVVEHGDYGPVEVSNLCARSITRHQQHLEVLVFSTPACQTHTDTMMTQCSTGPYHLSVLCGHT